MWTCISVNQYPSLIREHFQLSVSFSFIFVNKKTLLHPPITPCTGNNRWQLYLVNIFLSVSGNHRYNNILCIPIFSPDNECGRWFMSCKNSVSCMHCGKPCLCQRTGDVQYTLVSGKKEVLLWVVRTAVRPQFMGLHCRTWTTKLEEGDSQNEQICCRSILFHRTLKEGLNSHL